MARSEEVERRLMNWVRWKKGGASGGLGFATASMGTEAGGTRYREAVIPTAAAEAMETDNVVTMLEADLRRIVNEHYLEGSSVAGVSVKLGCSVATVYSKLQRVHVLLDQAFRDMAQHRRAERERVELVLRQARP